MSALIGYKFSLSNNVFSIETSHEIDTLIASIAQFPNGKLKQTLVCSGQNGIVVITHEQ